MKQLYSITIILLVFLVMTSSVRAATPSAEMVRVSPVLLTVTLSPGKTTSHTISVENLTDTPLPFHAELADVQLPGTDTDSTTPTITTSPTPSWITLANPDLLIPPHSKQDLRLDISLPDTLSLGSLYAIVYLTPLIPVSSMDAPHVIPRVGVPVLGNIGVQQTLPPSQRARIPFFSLPGLTASLTAIPWQLRVTNTQLQYFSAKPILTMSRLFGEQQITTYPEKIILPGKTRDWDDGVNVTAYGFYTATMRISLGHGDTISIRTYTIVAPWTRIGILIVVLILLLFLMRHRKQLPQAIRTLVQGS